MQRILILVGLILTDAVFTAPLQGADSFWSNSSGGDFTNPANWNAGVPGAANAANFTNNASYQVDWSTSVTNANAFFNAPGGIVTQAIGSSFWLVTNSYIIGQNGGATATVVQTSGNLFVTNASGTAKIVVGSSGIGNLDIEGGTVTTPTIVLGNVLFSSGHSLTIANGASLLTATGTIGGSTGTDNNRALVSGPGSTWNNSGVLTVGFRGTGNQLTITNQGFVSSGSTIVGDSSGLGQILRVDGNGSILTNAGDLVVGNIAGIGSSMWIANSGKVYNASGTVGYNGTVSNDLVVVSGQGSRWINSQTNFIGNFSSFNTLTITNGGYVQAAVGIIGNAGNGSNNLVTVTDLGSVWTNSGALIVGNILGGGVSHDNRLIITNGGKVYSSGATVGATAGDNNNSVVVDGEGSELNDNGNLLVGSTAGSGQGTGNSVSILNSGLVANAIATIGGNAGADFNSVTVNGTGSVWTNTGAITVGFRGTGNQLIITNGGIVYSASSGLTNAGSPYVASGVIGNESSARSGLVVVTGNGSVWTNTGALEVGHAGHGNELLISESGKVYSAAGAIGGYGGNTNFVGVSGAGSSWNIVSNLLVGYSGFGNQLVVSDGGLVNSTTGFIGGVAGGFSSASNNSVTVTGSGSVWSNTASLIIGISASSNSMTISSGGKVFNTDAIIGYNSSTSSNSVTVTGDGSQWNINGDLWVGSSASGSGSAGGDSLTIANSGMVVNANAIIGRGVALNNNLVEVTGKGSVWTNSGSITVGFRTAGNQLIVTNGGVAYATSVLLGSGTVVDSNNMVTITGDGSQLILAGTGVTVGSAAKGTNRVIVTDGGLLEANTLIASAAAQNIISNVGGIYQFTTNLPTITTNSASPITLANGTISFRGITNANVFGDVSGSQLTNMVFSGSNTFRLNNAANASGVSAYTFDTGHGATNYVGLDLVNGITLWRSANLTIGSGGTLLASNTIGAVSALVMNTGTIYVVNSKITFSSNVVVSGKYVSDPSTNTFAGDLTVTSSGMIVGGAGDLFDFKKSFYNHNSSNPTGAFNLASSTVSFSGGAPGATVIHTNAITGMDFGNDGTNGFPDGFTPQNFKYGRLTLGSTNDVVCFECGSIPAVAGNGLYIGWLDLTSLTNQASVSWLVTNLLHAPTNINLYYFAGDTRNSYLNDQVFALTDCNGFAGGYLMPAIPEPSVTLLALLASVGCLLRRRSTRQD